MGYSNSDAQNYSGSDSFIFHALLDGRSVRVWSHYESTYQKVLGASHTSEKASILFGEMMARLCCSLQQRRLDKDQLSTDASVFVKSAFGLYIICNNFWYSLSDL